jgi:membrane-bound metal-dependent hydrolase YbcI (DUF457 family)
LIGILRVRSLRTLLARLRRRGHSISLSFQSDLVGLIFRARTLDFSLAKAFQALPFGISQITFRDIFFGNKIGPMKGKLDGQRAFVPLRAWFL